MFKVVYNEKRRINQCNVLFFLAEINNIKNAIEETYNCISNVSWINNFSDENVIKAYCVRTKITIDKLREAFEQVNFLSSSTGEYIISITAKNVIVSELKYKDIPLGELIKERAIGNGGFDYYSENLIDKIAIFGEAKYKKNTSTYSIAINQIVSFINKEKDVSDFLEVDKFMEYETAVNMNNKVKGFSAGFCFYGNEKKIIDYLMKSNDFIELTKYKEIILIGVKFNEN